MANPEIEIYKSVRRFSDYTKDAVVNSVVEKLRDSQNNIEEAALSEIVHLIESTFEQCNFNGFREVETTVRSVLK